MAKGIVAARCVRSVLASRPRRRIASQLKPSRRAGQWHDRSQKALATDRLILAGMNSSSPHEPVLTLRSALCDVGLLALRLTAGCFMLIGHGWGKFTTFQSKPETFPDPLGIGGTMSFYGAVGAEVVCAALIAVGLLTRLACLPLIFAMGVAAFVIHKNDAFFMGGGAAKEPALLYLLMGLTIALTGPGRLSIDNLLFRGWLRPQAR